MAAPVGTAGTNLRESPAPGQSSNIPCELRALPQWLLWRHEQRDGRRTKVPHNPNRPRERADTTDPGTWATYRKATRVLHANRERFDGIGFVFSDSDPFAGIDFDGVLDPESAGNIAAWAVPWIKRLGGYCEVSPSGRGVHVIVRGAAPNRNNRSAGVEAYSRARFFTVTGDALADGSDGLPERQAVIDELAECFFTKPASNLRDDGELPSNPVPEDDAALLERARNSRRGAEFQKLYDAGDISGYPSHSEADFAMCKMLAFWTAWDAGRIDRLFRASALYRPKWNRGNYGERTIAAAIAATPRAYRQPPRGDAVDDPRARVVAACRAMAAREPWAGRSGPTDAAVFGALVDLAERYGTPRERGIIVSADARTLALEAGVSFPTAKKSLERLREDRKMIRRIQRGSGTRAAAYLLKVDLRKGYPQYSCASYGQPLRKLRNAAPIPQKAYDRNGRKIVAPGFLKQRVGKLAALVLERVVAATDRGGLTRREVAEALERRACDLERKLAWLLADGLLVEDDAGRLSIPEDFAESLERELEVSGSNDAERRQRERYEREREAYRKRHENKADPVPEKRPAGEIHELERVPDTDPALLEAVRIGRERFPRLPGEHPSDIAYASWLGSSLWCTDLYPGKPTATEVQAALERLQSEGVAA
jgi:putative DNA primase/helicase